MKRSKRYSEIFKKVDRTKAYTLDEVLKLIPQLSRKDRNESVEIHIHLRMNDKEKNQGLNFSYTLPHISEESAVKIAVLADPKEQKDAKKAGADEVGLEDLAKKIEGGWTDFDVLIASPLVMPQIAKLGKVLGPKGLMPNSKNDTVTQDFERVIKSFRAGKKNAKLDNGANLHFKVGNTSMESESIKENIKAVFDLVQSESKKMFPSGYKSVNIKTNMSPAIKIDLNDIANAYEA